jgi:hypothetical protein
MAAAEGFLGSLTKLPKDLFPVILFTDQDKDTSLRLSETLAFASVLELHCNTERCVPSAEYVTVWRNGTISGVPMSDVHAL